MLDSTKVVVTKHALERYSERVAGRTVTVRDVELHVRAASTVDNKTKNRLLRSCPFTRWKYKTRTGNNLLLKSADVVFVMSIESTGEFRVVTCWKDDFKK